MGSRTSTRWNGHEKAPLVEESLAIDLRLLHRGGLFEKPPGEPLPLSWTRDDDGGLTAIGAVALTPAVAGQRQLLVVGLKTPWTVVPIRAALPIVQRARRRCLECPACHRAFAKLYVALGGFSVRCRKCLGLQHRSSQQHDKRLDQVRRDPEAFLEARQGLGGLYSSFVTMRFAEQALLAPLRRPRGRGWGRKSMTSWRRVQAKIAQVLEERTGKPLRSVLSGRATPG